MSKKRLSGDQGVDSPAGVVTTPTFRVARRTSSDGGLQPIYTLSKPVSSIVETLQSLSAEKEKEKLWSLHSHPIARSESTATQPENLEQLALELESTPPQPWSPTSKLFSRHVAPSASPRQVEAEPAEASSSHIPIPPTTSSSNHTPPHDTPSLPSTSTSGALPQEPSTSPPSLPPPSPSTHPSANDPRQDPLLDPPGPLFQELSLGASPGPPPQSSPHPPLQPSLAHPSQSADPAARGSQEGESSLRGELSLRGESSLGGAAPLDPSSDPSQDPSLEGGLVRGPSLSLRTVKRKSAEVVEETFLEALAASLGTPRETPRPPFEGGSPEGSPQETLPATPGPDRDVAGAPLERSTRSNKLEVGEGASLS